MIQFYSNYEIYNFELRAIFEEVYQTHVDFYSTNKVFSKFSAKHGHFWEVKGVFYDHDKIQGLRTRSNKYRNDILHIDIREFVTTFCFNAKNIFF